METVTKRAESTGKNRAPGDSGETSLGELALLFLRLGATAFGGPAAHIAMMRDEVVRRRQWLTEQQFLDLLSATNLIPGPNSTEMAIHVGWTRRRWAGLLVTGVSFIVPAMLMTDALGWAYVRFGRLPEAGWLLWGVKPVILAVVAQALWNLAPAAATTWFLRGIGILAAVVSAIGLNELAILFAAAAVAAGARAAAARRGSDLNQLIPLVPIAAGAVAPAAVSLSGLFAVFRKIGSASRSFPGCAPRDCPPDPRRTERRFTGAGSSPLRVNPGPALGCPAALSLRRWSSASRRRSRAPARRRRREKDSWR